MGLTPGKFMRRNVRSFTKVLDARNQVTRVYQDPVRDAVVRVASVIVCIRREYPGERIDPGTGAD
jgi:hypothetical protein